LTAPDGRPPVPSRIGAHSGRTPSRPTTRQPAVPLAAPAATQPAVEVSKGARARGIPRRMPFETFETPVGVESGARRAARMSAATRLRGGLEGRKSPRPPARTMSGLQRSCLPEISGPRRTARRSAVMTFGRSTRAGRRDTVDRRRPPRDTGRSGGDRRSSKSHDPGPRDTSGSIDGAAKPAVGEVSKGAKGVVRSVIHLTRLSRPRPRVVPGNEAPPQPGGP